MKRQMRAFVGFRTAPPQCSAVQIFLTENKNVYVCELQTLRGRRAGMEKKNDQ